MITNFYDKSQIKTFYSKVTSDDLWETEKRETQHSFLNTHS